MQHDKVQRSEWGLEEHPSTELLRQYEEGALPPAAENDLERHLLDCELCTDILTGMSFSDRTRTRQVEQRIWQRIHTRLRRKRRPRTLAGLGDWRVALGVLMMFCSLGLLFFYQYTRMAAQEREALQAAEAQPPSPDELLARTIDAALVLEIPAPPTLADGPRAMAADAPAVMGRVVSDGKGVPEATVQVQGSPLSTHTDAQGYFRLPLDEGSHTLLISGQHVRAQTYEVHSPSQDLMLRLRPR